MSRIRLISSKYIVFFISLLLLTFISPSQTVAEAETSGRYFNSLQERLIKDGFNKSTITEIYNKPQVYFETKGIAHYLGHNEAKLNYDQFASVESIQKALEYIEKIDKMGGMSAAIERGYVQTEIQNNAYMDQKRVEEGINQVIGVILIVQKKNAE